MPSLPDMMTADAEALARAVNVLLTDDAMRRAACIEARAYAELHMDRKTILDGLGRALLEAVPGKGDFNTTDPRTSCRIPSR